MNFSRRRSHLFLYLTMGLLVLWMGVVLTSLLVEGSLSYGERSQINVSRIPEGNGLAYRYRPTERQLQLLAQRSDAVLLENGEAEGLQRVATSAEVVAKGAGTYATTFKNLYMSSTDNTDPRTNGRVYEIVFPYHLPAWTPRAIGISGGVIAGLLLLATLILKRKPLIRAARPAPSVIRGSLLAVITTIRQSLFWKLILAVTLLRLVLISYDELVASDSDPLEYVWLATKWFYGQHPYYYYRLPVYPLFIALTDLTGLPHRLVLEAMQIFSYITFVAALLRFRVARAAVFAIYAWFILSPQTAQWNNYTQPDACYVTIMIFTVSAGLLWIASGRAWLGALVGLLIALLLNMREERPLNVALAAGIVLLYLIAQFARHTPGTREYSFRKLRRWTVGPMVMLGTMILLNTLFQTAFYFRTQIWGQCLLSTPGISAFMTSMFRIPVTTPTDHGFLINQEVRKKAAELSPTFRQVLPEIEKDSVFSQSNLENYQTRDLIVDQFLWLAFHNGMASQAIQYANPSKQRDDLFQKVALEVTQGLQGKEQQKIYLGGTFPINSTVLATFLAEWRSLLHLVMTVSFEPCRTVFLPISEVRADAVGYYADVTNRRLSLAAELDKTGVTRPAWIQAVWAGLYRLQIGTLYLCLAGSVMVPLAVWVSRGFSFPRVTLAGFTRLAPLFILLYIASSRIFFGCLVGVYFGVASRYMLPFTMVSVPLLILIMDACRSEGQKDYESA